MIRSASIGCSSSPLAIQIIGANRSASSSRSGSSTGASGSSAAYGGVEIWLAPRLSTVAPSAVIQRRVPHSSPFGPGASGFIVISTRSSGPKTRSDRSGRSSTDTHWVPSSRHTPGGARSFA